MTILRNYFLVAVRNIIKQKFYSLINILGLTIGVVATMFIILYIMDELSFDRFHDKIDRMYRVGLNGKLAGQEVRVTSTPPPLAAALTDEVPGVEQAIRIWEWSDVVIRYEEGCALMK
jgi:putative ABC transport system permease protein